MMVSAMPDTGGAGMPYPPLPTAEEVESVDRAEHDHAESAAAAGVRLAREHGATAEPLALPDTGHVAETLAEVAEGRDAAALVVGSRGLGGVKSRVLGSTSRKLLHDTRRPVLVVRAPS
jgi:nucleotide-binding universal stress UspA family protein